MIVPGLVSITFRALRVEQIVQLCSQNGLRGIEWGGDIHVPPGDLDNARRVHTLTEDAGLTVAAYGSYWRAGEPEGADNPALLSVLDTAQALNAPLVRVWAGRRGTAEADPPYTSGVFHDLRKAVALAAERGLTVAAEFHGGTLTDTPDAALNSLNAVPGLRSLWQPAVGVTPAARLAGLRRLLPYVENIHVFQWTNGYDRLPLSGGTDEWRAYLQTLHSDGLSRFALLEFVAGDDPDALAHDARTLHELLAAPSLDNKSLLRP